MKSNYLKIMQGLSLCILLAFTSSCKKDKTVPDPINNKPGNVNVEASYVFGANALPWELNQKLVHPKTGDTLTFTEMSFYISNVKLKKEDGTWWSEPESYHLICAKCTDKRKFTMKDVPAGKYTEMTYTLGVDSTRNVSGAQTGDLSPSEGMFWSWSSGYIMIKAEGTSPQSSNGNFMFHLGGFKGQYSAVQTKTLSFNGATANVSENTTPTIVLQVNPARLWHTAPSVSVRNKLMMPNAETKTMADDFAAGITFKTIK